MNMNFDLMFSEWLLQFYFLKDIAEVFSGRFFSGTLVILIGLYSLKVKQFRIFIFICLATGIGDLTGNILKDFFQDPDLVSIIMRNFRWLKGVVQT